MSQSPDDQNRTADTNLSGQQFGDFRVLRRLGRGAMAEVYLAEQGQLKRMVALKVLRADFSNDSTYLRRFEREAQAAASLVHANIVQIYDVGKSGSVHYIAQEYVQGPTLREWVARQGLPDLPHALSIMRQVASALTKAADLGVVHRDIKPENIMLTREGEVKVADFGLARLTQGTEDSELTQIGMTMGTPLYMSPEQVEGKPLDTRSDLYSFGVTCYHMLSGEPPFSGETALGVAVQHLRTEPTRLETLRPDLPAALCGVVHRLLAKSPDQRFQSPRELLLELRRIQAEYCGDEWPEQLPAWEVTSADAPALRRSQLTQQLGSLMQTLELERVKPPRRWRVASLVAAGMAVGLLAAWLLTVDRPLLTPMAEGATQQRDTARKQWYYAARENTPQAWNDVINYPKVENSLKQRARCQLAGLYLAKGDYPAAMAELNELSGETDSSLRAFGLAGKVIVFVEMGQWDEADSARRQLEHVGTVPRGPIDRMYETAVQKLRERNRGERPESSADRGGPPGDRNGPTRERSLPSNDRSTPPSGAGRVSLGSEADRRTASPPTASSGEARPRPSAPAAK